MENKIKIRKVHLPSFMALLQEIYDRGVDFVDVYGIMEDGQDTVGLSFCREYMNEEFVENFDTLGEEQLPSKMDVKKLSDEDLNELL